MKKWLELQGKPFKETNNSCLKGKEVLLEPIVRAILGFYSIGMKRIGLRM
jgi:hypothetical protein